MIKTCINTLALEFEMLSKKEIMEFAKNPSEFEKLLPKLTMDEIASLLEKIDNLIACSPPKKMYADLMRLKMMALEEESLREEFEID